LSGDIEHLSAHVFIFEALGVTANSVALSRDGAGPPAAALPIGPEGYSRRSVPSISASAASASAISRR
jgi:hypothetical protein